MSDSKPDLIKAKVLDEKALAKEPKLFNNNL
jgi:hypothetical protein